MPEQYDASDAGCYVDGSRGVYAIDMIVEIAEAHGFVTAIGPDCQHEEGSLSECEFAAEIEDEATEYMNERWGVDDHYWGRSEQGDWGLWPTKDMA